MQIINSIATWKAERKNLAGKTIGFVPTMGNLHQGHASLIERSVAENDVTVLSIYVNPTQFDNQGDFTNYPKTLPQDSDMAAQLKVDYILTPTYQELYPDNYAYKVTENSEQSLILEGKHRPGHFTGMLTVVLKLLLLVQADCAYFGEKDYQQLTLVRSLAEAFLLDVQIIACPIVRNSEGLPLSSRNNRLPAARLKHAALFSTLLAADLSIIEIKNKLSAAGFAVDYIEEHAGRRFGAIKLDGIRLIDNVMCWALPKSSW